MIQGDWGISLTVLKLKMCNKAVCMEPAWNHVPDNFKTGTMCKKDVEDKPEY